MTNGSTDVGGAAEREALLLISVSGQDQRASTPALCAVLAQHDVAILDVSQAVIHDQATLGFVVAMADGADTSELIKEVLFRSHELGLTARFEPLSAASFAARAERLDRARYIVTLLARRLSGAHLARVTEIAERFGQRVDAVRRLSGGAGGTPRASVEIAVRGEPSDPAAIRAAFLAASAELDIDIAFQLDNVYRRNRRLVAFDMDSTLIEAEVIDELAREAGVGDEVAQITASAMAGELDFTESFRRRVALLEGLDESVLEQVAERLPLSEGAEQLVAQLRRLGYKTAILSGGFQYFGERLQRRLGIDYVYANQLEIDNGRVTGAVVGEVVDGARKAQLLEEIAGREGLTLDQVIAVGDGANDLPMLSIAGLGIAFRAKAVVRESAGQSISTLGLDAILYLLGFTDADLA